MNAQDWQRIWNAKYGRIDDSELHVAAGFDALNQDQWDDMTSQFLGLLDISPQHDVLEAYNLIIYHRVTGLYHGKCT